MNVNHLTSEQYYLQPGVTDSELRGAEAALGFALPDDYRSLLTWSNGGDLIFGERYLRFWSLEEVIRRNEVLEVSQSLPGHLAIGNDAGDMLYLLDYRADREHPALVEVDAGSMFLDEIVRHGDSLEAALRCWSGVDTAREKLLSLLVARAAESEAKHRSDPEGEG